MSWMIADLTSDMVNLEQIHEEVVTYRSVLFPAPAL